MRQRGRFEEFRMVSPLSMMAVPGNIDQKAGRGGRGGALCQSLNHARRFLMYGGTVARNFFTPYNNAMT